jgi:hypothetical protein
MQGNLAVTKHDFAAANCCISLSSSARILPNTPSEEDQSRHDSQCLCHKLVLLTLGVCAKTRLLGALHRIYHSWIAASASR